MPFAIREFLQGQPSLTFALAAKFQEHLPWQDLSESSPLPSGGRGKDGERSS
jgi:hypothetical protein